MLYTQDMVEGHGCPTCGKVLDTKPGLHRHHGHVHGESIARVTRVCRECGDEKEMYQSELEQLEHDDLCVGCSRKREIGHTDEARKKISQSHMGKTISEEHKQAVQEGWWEWWENEVNQEQWIEDLPTLDSMPQEARAKISKSLQGHEVSEETRQKIRENGKPGSFMSIDVEATGNTVKSTWEQEIDLLLHESGIQYAYEGAVFDLNTRRYTPDFITGETAIEVKGWASDDDIRRATEFLIMEPNWRYIVVGSEMPCDVYIAWEDRNELVNYL